MLQPRPPSTQRIDGVVPWHSQLPRPFSDTLPSIPSPIPGAYGLCQLHSRQCHSIFAEIIRGESQ